jgi:hypothetical protein
MEMERRVLSVSEHKIGVSVKFRSENPTLSAAITPILLWIRILWILEGNIFERLFSFL